MTMKETLHRKLQRTGLLMSGFFCSSLILVASDGKFPESTGNLDKQDMALLRAQLTAQQEQIDQLRQELQAQKKLILQSRQAAEDVSSSTLGGSSPPAPNSREIASLSLAIPAERAPLAPSPSVQSQYGSARVGA